MGGKGIGNLRALTEICLSFNQCLSLTSVDELGKGIGNLHNLIDLKLQLRGCTAITSVDALGQGICWLQSLSSLSIICNDSATIRKHALQCAKLQKRSITRGY